MDAEQFWLTPLGLFLDLWACHRQYLGLEKSVQDVSVDDVIPFDC